MDVHLGVGWSTRPLTDIDPLGPGSDKAHDAGVDEAIMDDALLELVRSGDLEGARQYLRSALGLTGSTA